MKQLKQLPKVLTLKEKRIVSISLLLISVSVVFTIGRLYYQHFLPTPVRGGQYTEGLIGAPQYINPLLSQTNDVDFDISRLIFSGLLKYDNNLQLIGDLAENWQVSNDKKTYTFKLKENLKWHDGKPLSADDVVFTVKSIQDPAFKSPLLGSLRGVKVEKVDDRQVLFTLPEEPYPNFLEALTFGILPEHIWGEIPPINANLTEYNLKPIGSGPWQFKSSIKDRLGNIKSYTLIVNPNYSGPKPYLEKITFKFYPDFQTAVGALQNNSVEGVSFMPKEFKKELSGNKNLRYYSFYLPQYTAIFFNQKENEFLKEKRVRTALALAINKPKILTEVLQGEGEIIEGPILPGFIGYNPDLKKISFNVDEAAKLLDEAGWTKITAEEYQKFLQTQKEKEEKEKKPILPAPAGLPAQAGGVEKTQATSTEKNGENAESDQQALEQPTQAVYRKKGDQILEVTLTTVNQPQRIAAAELIKEFWQKIGVKVNLEIVEPTKIAREIIKPRKYQALLFGIITGSDPDPYPFWHSSQIQDPGLNLALFANRQVDSLLEEAKKTTEEKEREKKFKEFENIVTAEIAAIFLYNPTYTYIVDQKIKGINTERIVVPADRFNNLSDWYVKTKRTYKTQ